MSATEMRSATSEAAAGPALTVVAATTFEAALIRLALRGRAPVRRAGIGLSRGLLAATPALVSCGLAGALGPGLPSGTVVIPDEIGSAVGPSWRCDPVLVARLRAAAGRLGVECRAGRLLTVPWLVTGAERAAWAARGWDVVDMESAGLFGSSGCVAAVRVVLDGPGRELDRAWGEPWRAARQPLRWPEAVGLAAAATAGTLRAARVVAAATR